MTFARWVFTTAGIVGVLMIAPLFFLEGQMAGVRGPISHAENYYGFLGVTLAWQLVYLVIGRDPAPYRPIMLLGALGKAVFFVCVWTLYAQGRTPLDVAAVSSIDIVWAALFVVAWSRTRPAMAGSP
jgi:hypothetical protein